MIKMFCGAMYSGKSESLVRDMIKLTYSKKKILFVRPVIDDRGYVTHSRSDFKLSDSIEKGKIEVAFLKFFDDVVINKILDERYDAVFVDEYFMIKNNRKLAESLLSSGVKTDVYFGGLIADSDAKMFDEAVQILPLCDEIEKLNGVCTKCGSMLGNYSYYKGTKSNQIEVGDAKYECVCGKCYFGGMK